MEADYSLITHEEYDRHIARRIRGRLAVNSLCALFCKLDDREMQATKLISRVSRVRTAAYGSYIIEMLVLPPPSHKADTPVNALGTFTKGISTNIGVSLALEEISTKEKYTVNEAFLSSYNESMADDVAKEHLAVDEPPEFEPFRSRRPFRFQ